MSANGKLEMALSNVTSPHQQSDSDVSHSGAMDVQPYQSQTNGPGSNIGASGEEEAGDNSTPTATRRRSTVTFSDVPLGPATQGDGPQVGIPKTPLSPEYHSAQEGSPEIKKDRSNEDAPVRPLGGERERKVSGTSISSNHLMRPGVGLRIKKRLSDSSAIVEFGQVEGKTEGGHAKVSTADSGISEMIVSPSPSQFSDVGQGDRVRIVDSDKNGETEQGVSSVSFGKEEPKLGKEGGVRSTEMTPTHRVPFADVK